MTERQSVYLRLSAQPVAEAEVRQTIAVSQANIADVPCINVDYDADGNPVGVEVLDVLAIEVDGVALGTLLSNEGPDDDVLAVLRFVALGRGHAWNGALYPDAAARRALGRLGR